MAALCTNRGLQAVVLYRISRLLWQKHVVVAPSILTRLVQMLYGIDISYKAEIGPGCVIFHGFGLVVASYVKVGRGAVLHQGVTLGTRSYSRMSEDTPDGLPTVGDHVFIGAGAKILGNVIVGDNAVIGANAVVVSSVPAGHTAVGVPAIKRPRSEGKHYATERNPSGDTAI
ncbi:MAG: Serine O-acetyltransferase [Chloroflexi bacterium]|nr:Serine O-acetyltransferase [Chloroflexota bacterium]